MAVSVPTETLAALQADFKSEGYRCTHVRRVGKCNIFSAQQLMVFLCSFAGLGIFLMT